MKQGEAINNLCHFRRLLNDEMEQQVWMLGDKELLGVWDPCIL